MNNRLVTIQWEDIDERIAGIMECGFTFHNATFLADCEKWCKEYYEYETEHIDAANNYEASLCNLLSLDSYDIIRIEFTTELNAPHSIYLGQEEVEIQLPRKLNEKERDWFNTHTDFSVSAYSEGLAYSGYPDNLSVQAILTADWSIR